MRSRGLRVVLVLVLVLALGWACRDTPVQKNRTGRLEAAWAGADSGKISGAATAEWCGVRRLLEIRAVQGDTGLALALYPAETLAAGVYRVVDPAKADSVPPAAGVALRWLAQTTIQGLQGDSGTVVLERSGAGELSGVLTAKARSVVNGERVTVTGSFRNLVVRPHVRGCSMESPPPPADEDPEPSDTDDDAEPPDKGVH